ncbi:Innexin unc-9 [Schistosoma japonicum]|uniref:Innexin n=2 Tax=Schistosoma japonicum TaxID=6182 RepID=A0A4Z2DYV9_SCHJA|nr:Innexin unc-9 [Schistosoma japonicum]
MDTHFFAGLTKFKLDAGKFRRDDDFSDRFSHTFTSLLLIIFTLIISARQYIGKPIACWVPTEFTRAQEEYAESVCWVTSTYFIPTQEVNVPENISERENRKIHYYQWVPFILMIQAFMFNLPCLIWRLFNWQSGIHLSSIMEVACEIEMIKDPETRKSNITYVARHIEDALTSQREYRSGCSVRFKHCLARSCCLWFGKRYGNYLICLYLITKSLYIFNVVGQFFLMNKILGTNYTFYGLDLLRDISEGYVWQESGNFPRITLCDFEVRKVANKHRHTVQCVLPINMFNEKIFIFLWFWFILVAAVNTSSFLYWSYKSSFRGTRIQFIRKFLKLRGALEPGDKKKTLTFVDTYLRQDGVFILRLTAQNAGELVASEIVERLWIMYRAHQNITTTSTSQSVPYQFRQQPQHQPPHRPSHHHHHRSSTASSNNRRGSRSLTPVSPSNSLDVRRKPPPSYPSYQLRPPPANPERSQLPPPLPPPLRPSAPPPLPPSLGTTTSGSIDGTSNSVTSHSQQSTVTENTDQLVRMRPVISGSVGFENFKSVVSQSSDLKSSSAIRKRLLTTEGSSLLETVGIRPTTPIQQRQINNQSSHIRSQSEDDPGEFV